MMNLIEMQADVAQVNREHGWFDVDRTFGEGIALLHSEVSEALEEYRKHFFHTWLAGSKPEGVGSELADVLIRLLDMAERSDIQLFTWIRDFPGAFAIPERFGDQVAKLHFFISRLGIAQDSGHEPLGRYMADIFLYLYAVADFNNINLEAEYARKFAYNKTRPYRHGGKKL